MFNFTSKKVSIFIVLLLFLTLFLNVFKKSEAPSCLNADEVAFGYNAYSISKTLRDEHGNFLPQRLRSFDDYKMPLYSYFSIPFISLFGMTDYSIRFLNVVVAVLLALFSYLLFKRISRDPKIGLMGSFFTSTSLWTLIVTRHSHEAALSTLFIVISSYFAVAYFENKSVKNVLLSVLLGILAAFSYHIGRIYLVYLVFAILTTLITHAKGMTNSKKIIGILSAGFLAPIIFDLRYGANRLSNLVFYKNVGFSLRITEYFNEHTIRALHNKLTEGVVVLSHKYIEQLSPTFLTISGDANLRFGLPEMSPITPVMFVLVLIGVFAVFQQKKSHRLFMLGLLLVAPIGNVLTWQPVSLTRTFFLIVPMSYFAAYGFFKLSRDVSEFIRNYVSLNLIKIVPTLLFSLHLFFLIMSYDLYFFHYFNKTTVESTWQCGSKQMAEYVHQNYDTFDTFYISRKNGQPYMYLLFYNQMDPRSFQKTSRRTGRDEYGFTQVAQFDKFVFELPKVKDKQRSVYIGFSDEMTGERVDDRILNGSGREVFTVKENR